MRIVADRNMLQVRQVIFLVSTVCVQTSMSYHVLFYHNWGTKSHIIQFAPVLEELLGRGHEVTAVIFNSIKLKNENYTEILVPNAGEQIISKISEATMSQNGQILTQLKLSLSYQTLSIETGTFFLQKIIMKSYWQQRSTVHPSKKKKSWHRF